MRQRRPLCARAPEGLADWRMVLAFDAGAGAGVLDALPATVDVCLPRSPHAGRLLDLGGGQGEHALEPARRGLQTTTQDPELIDLAGCRGLADAGVELFAGDFFFAMGSLHP